MGVEDPQLAAPVGQARRPPMVALALPDKRLPAALLVWGRCEDVGWLAGVCYLHRTWHSRALVTTWAPAARVGAYRGVDYRRVPRVRLHGDQSRWPALPPAYPGAGEQWLALHQHLDFGDLPR